MQTIYLVPHSHYDVVWAFNREDYFFINTHIIEKAERMINDSDFKFLIEQVYLLEQLEKLKPDLFKKIRKAIKEDKIEIVDGSYIMPDLMIPEGETLIRGILVGKRYAKETFGKKIPVAYAADSFGLNAQMPQIYRKSGYNWLVFRRGLPRLIGQKVSEFMWEGLDGTRIPTHWMPLGYRAGLEMDKWEEAVHKLTILATTGIVYLPCGSGGVPPQYETPEKVREWNERHVDSTMVIATPSSFFNHFDKEKKFLPVFSGELYSVELEDVFPDVVSSRISLKLAIKESEDNLLLAEKLAALAYLKGTQYPDKAMKSLWKKMLFLANHDVMPSSGIDEIYEEAWDYIGTIKDQSKDIITAAANQIVKSGEKAGNDCIAVFNPYNWQVTDWVQEEFNFENGPDHEQGVFSHGKEIPSEIIEKEVDEKGRIKKIKLGFMSTVRALNHNVYKLNMRTETFIKKISILDDQVVHTPFFDLRVEEKTGIMTVFDHDGRLLLKGNEVIIDEELGDLYFHSQILEGVIASESGEGVKFGAFKPEPISIEQGLLRTVITYKSAYYCLRWPYYLTEKFGSHLYRQKTLSLTKKVIIYEDIPRIDFVMKVNLIQPHVRLRLKFDTGMVIPQYTRQTQFGAISVSDRNLFEEGANVPSPVWVTAEEGNRGLAFITPTVPINKIQAGEIYYTLLRSVSVLSADGKSGPLIPTPGAMELGEHTYTYSIYPYDGTWQDNNIYRSAYESGQSLIPVRVGSARNISYQSFSISPENMIISALKKAEDDEAIVLRFFETEGQVCQAAITLPEQIKAVHLVNLLEEKQKVLEIKKNKIKMDVGTFEIITLKLFL